MQARKHIQTAIIGPAGTGKSYLLNGLIEMLKSHGLVVAKLAPSGVTAHPIGGTTIHNLFALDIALNCQLENGTLHVAHLRKTDVLVIYKFSSKCIHCTEVYRPVLTLYTLYETA